MITTGRRKVVLVALTVTSVAVAGVGVASPRGGGANGAQQQTCPLPILGADPDTVTLSGPATLWPPNHRLVGYTLTASETPGEKGDGLQHGVTISYSVGVSDGGATSPAQQTDAKPPTGAATGDFTVPVHFQLRAQRPGQSARTYTITWTASFDGGVHTCSSNGSDQHPFTVTVPHDERG